MNPDYWKQIDIGGAMFDYEHFYASIAAVMPDNCILAEIGVANGKSLLYMAGRLHLLKKNFTIHDIDNMDYGGDFQVNTILDNIAAAGFEKQIVLHRKDSLCASRLFPDRYFDFVFIDASHDYEHVKADIRLWQHKVKPTGILAGHDIEMSEVKRAVIECAAVKQFNTIPTTNNLGVWFYSIPQKQQ